MSDRIDPQTPLSVTLSARQWNSAMAMIGEGMNSIGALIAEIQRQCMAQGIPEHMPPRGNGVAAEDRTDVR